MEDTLSIFEDIGNTVANVRNAFRGTPTPSAAAPAPAATNYKPWIIGGVAAVALLIVVGLIFGRRS